MSIVAAFVTIGTIEFDRSIDFYTGLTGSPPAIYQSRRYAEFHFGGLRLAVFYPQASSADTFTPRLAGTVSICLAVDNLEAAISRLADLGYPPSGEIITSSHGREIYACDPDANRLILYQGF
jgi:catechol 2,3-dioxygenase-like lactoylglutathione lyase family enzyme